MDTKRKKEGRHSKTIFLRVAAALVLSAAVLGSCNTMPATLVISITLQNPSSTALPDPSSLYLRMMDPAGTVLWSNEMSPYRIDSPRNSDTYRYVISLKNSELTSPDHLYTVDAYLYETPVSSPPINPIQGGDTQLLTEPAIPNPTPGPTTPRYKSAPHLENNIFIESGTQRQVFLTLISLP